MSCASVCSNLGAVLYESGETDRAIKALEWAAEMQEDMIYNLCAALAKEKQFKKAHKCFSKALKLTVKQLSNTRWPCSLPSLPAPLHAPLLPAPLHAPLLTAP